MKKILTALIATALISITATTFSASAETSNLPKEEIKAGIWEEIWHGKGDDGTEFPESSFKHDLLSDWVDENYGSDDYDWYNIYNPKAEYLDYYERLTGELDFEDDRNGNWYITDENGIEYHFEYADGEWHEFDSNGNEVRIFPPFSTLEETNDKSLQADKSEINYADDTDTDKQAHRVTGTAPVQSSESNSTTSSNAVSDVTDVSEGNAMLPIVCVLGGISIAGIVIVVIAKCKSK